MNRLAHVVDDDLGEVYELEEDQTFIAHENSSTGETVFKFETINQLASMLISVGEDLVKYGPKVVKNIGFRKMDVNLEALLVTTFEDVEDEEEEEEDENVLHVGMMIAYRVSFYLVKDIREDGVWGVGPYGEEQFIDWEDFEKYNPDIKRK